MSMLPATRSWLLWPLELVHVRLGCAASLAAEMWLQPAATCRVARCGLLGSGVSEPFLLRAACGSLGKLNIVVRSPPCTITLCASAPCLRCAARGNLDTLNMEFNKLNKEIGALRKVRMRRRSLAVRGH